MLTAPVGRMSRYKFRLLEGGNADNVRSHDCGRATILIRLCAR